MSNKINIILKKADIIGKNSFKELSKKDSLKNTINSFLHSFKLPLNIEDLSNIEKLSKKELKEIQKYINIILNGLIIDINIENYKNRIIIIIDGENINNSIIDLICNFNDIKNFHIFIEFILNKINTFKQRINSILLNYKLRKTAPGNDYIVMEIDDIMRNNSTGYVKKPIIPKEEINTSDFITKLKQEIKLNKKDETKETYKKEIELFIKNLKEDIKNSKNKNISLSFDDFDLDDDYKLDSQFFDYLKDGVKNSKRWRNILQIISEEELIQILKNYLKIDIDNENDILKEIRNIGVNEKLSPDEIEQLEANSISKKIKPDFKIDIKDFLPKLQEEINQRALEKDPNANLDNYKVIQGHFTIIFNIRQNTYIYPELFDDREKSFRNMIKRKNYGKKRKIIKKTRWDYIYDVMSKKELTQFLLEFMQKERN